MTEQTKLTPMLDQYLRIKEEHPDALLFFRMGDFYELFFEDAQVAARELQIALTARHRGTDKEVPMCGVPYHSVEEYLRILLENRHKIAICDQIEDPRQAKGLVKREVTRILTPGTVVEESSLQSKTNNFLAGICLNGSESEGGLAWIDFSTGAWTGIASKSPAELWQWLGKLNPGEIICPEGLAWPGQLHEMRDRVTRVPFTAYFDFKRARETVCSIQGTAGLDPLDLSDKPQLVQACGAILSYLRQTQKQDLSHIKPFGPLNLSRHLILDEVTERNLELFQRLDGGKGPGTLWHVLDETMTPMGGRLLQTRIKQPWRELGPISSQQEAVAYLAASDKLRERLRTDLDRVYDLERLSTRIFLNRCSPKDFVSLRASLEELPGLEAALWSAAEQEGLPREMDRLLRAWDNLDDIKDLLQASLVESPPGVITEGGLFRSGYDAKLDELIELTEHGESKLKELLRREQEESGLPKLKLGYNRVFGYYFELSKAHKGAVPEHFHRRQTLVNAERYLTEELKQLEDKIFQANEQRKNLEYELFQTVRERVVEAGERIRAGADLLARLDSWQSLAQTAQKLDWVRPEIHAGQEMLIDQGRHPAVEASLGRSGYIPNDLSISEENKILLITGPNMAGKSTVLRQAAIICLLAQIGSFVPARQARLGLCDRIFTRVGASDNLTRGQSTFMLEMTETARILRQAGKRSLVILDEIGRGTSTYDGLSLAWAVVENLARKGEKGIRTLFATHYHELTDLEGKIPGVRNYNIAVKEWKGDIIFLRRLVPGPADRSYGIEVARLAGVPKPVIHRAREILSRLEEKSEQLRRGDDKASRQRKTLLPGLFESKTPKREPPPEPHPLIEELRRTDPDQLTPLQALSLLATWKRQWENSGDSQN